MTEPALGETLDAQEIGAHVRAAFGSSCEIESLSPFVGGVRKRTFVVRLRRPKTQCLLIVWQSWGQSFPERAAAGFEESQSDAVAPERFRENTEYLLGLGVKVPSLLYLGQLKAGHALAFVEWIDGTDYEKFAVGHSRSEVRAVLERLSVAMHRIHGEERSFPGSLSLERPDEWIAPEDESLATADIEVAATAKTHPEVAALRSQIVDRLQVLRGALTPRTSFRLLHGELDPSHIMVRSDGDVILVDIEGVGFSDLESEHAFVRWRFAADDYHVLSRDDLDPARMAFYAFRMHVSLVYAGSRLLLGDHPARHLAGNIYAMNLKAIQTSLLE